MPNLSLMQIIKTKIKETNVFFSVAHLYTDGLRDAMSVEILSNAAQAVWTSCTTNPRQIEAMELDHYGGPTCN